MSKFRTSTGAYNKSAIMKAAWVLFRMENGASTFGSCLRFYWNKARMEKPTPPAVAAINFEIMKLEMKTRMDAVDFARIEALKTQARQLAA